MSVSPSAGGEERLLQGLWDFVKAGQEEILLSPYLPACCAFLAHVLMCVPFFMLDVLACVSPRVRSWKIPPDSAPRPSARHWLDCFGRLVLKYLSVVLPVTAMLQSVLRSPVLPELAPTCYTVFVEVLACFLLFDALFFAWHFLMHRFPWLYRHVHQQHHQHKILFALAAQDASTVELLSLILLALLSARAVGCHPLSEVLFHLLSSWLAVEDHCGYDLPWALQNVLPGIGGAPHHQTHHIRHKTNYAPYFTHWDHLFGTYRE